MGLSLLGFGMVGIEGVREGRRWLMCRYDIVSCLLFFVKKSFRLCLCLLEKIFEREMGYLVT